VVATPAVPLAGAVDGGQEARIVLEKTGRRPVDFR
jgi:hypothetical protein